MMPHQDWKKVPIKELYLGFWDGPHATPKVADSGPIYLGIKNITEDGHLDFSDIRHIAEEDFPKWIKRVEPKAGDIVFTYEATLHRYAIIPEGFRGCLGRRLALIRTNPETVDTKFLYYYFFGKEWRNTVSKYVILGATVDRIPIIEFPKFEVNLPPLLVQRKIADVLSAYDDLIEVNTRRIHILEQIAQSVYREWFGKVYGKSPPEGWEIRTFSDVCNQIIDGDWIESKDQGGEDYRLLQVSNIGLGNFVETGNFRYITQETFERLNCQEVVPGDILVSRMPTPIGRGWLVTEMPWRMITAVDVAIVRPNPDLLNQYYCVYWLNSPETLDKSEKHSSGTTRPRITRRDLSAFDMVVPPIELQNKFGEFAGNLYSLQNTLERQNVNLRRTRDLLLPRLVSGEVAVHE